MGESKRVTLAFGDALVDPRGGRALRKAVDAHRTRVLKQCMLVPFDAPPGRADMGRHQKPSRAM